MSLERVKANLVRVLMDTNALVYSEIEKMGGVPPVTDSRNRWGLPPHGTDGV